MGLLRWTVAIAVYTASIAIFAGNFRYYGLGLNVLRALAITPPRVMYDIIDAARVSGLGIVSFAITAAIVTWPLLFRRSLLLTSVAMVALFVIPLPCIPGCSEGLFFFTLAPFYWGTVIIIHIVRRSVTQENAFVHSALSGTLSGIVLISFLLLPSFVLVGEAWFYSSAILGVTIFPLLSLLLLAGTIYSRMKQTRRST